MRWLPSRKKGYDAFLSHCHEDKQQVLWLAGVLHAFWVPRRARRRVFLDRNSLVATSLDKGIKTALDASDHLVVCVSGSVPASHWVGAEIDHFLSLEGRDPERVLICRVGSSAGKDPEGDARASAWIANLETRLGRKQGDHLVPDLRSDSLEENTSSALSLLAPMVGMADKDALLDRRARFLARAWRISAAVAFALLLAGLAAAWWVRTSDGAMWLHQRTLIAKAPGLKFDYAEWVGPAVLALAQAGEPDQARGLASMVKGKYFHATMTLAIEAGVPAPDLAKVRLLLAEAGRELGSGFPCAGLLGARIAGGEAARLQAWDALRNRTGEEPWMRALAASGWWDEALDAWQKWKQSRPTEVEEHLSLWLELHLLADRRPDVDSERTLRQEWQSRVNESRSLYHIQNVLIEAGLRGKLNDPVWKDVTATVAREALAILSEGTTPGTAAQPVAALAAMAGLHEEAGEILRMTAYLKDAPLENDRAAPLAFRALAEHVLGNEKDSADLFSDSVIAANAPIEATRTWREHTMVAKAMAMAGRWRQATELPAMVGAEMSRHILELELITWWHLRKAAAP